MGWRIPWVSSSGSDFNYDYQVSFTKEEIAKGEAYHNYKMQEIEIEEMSGISVFYKNMAGDVFHTYSTYGRGAEELVTAYVCLDLTPKGRNETGPGFNLDDWVRHHDRPGGAQVRLSTFWKCQNRKRIYDGVDFGGFRQLLQRLPSLRTNRRGVSSKIASPNSSLARLYFLLFSSKHRTPRSTVSAPPNDGLSGFPFMHSDLRTYLLWKRDRLKPAPTPDSRTRKAWQGRKYSSGLGLLDNLNRRKVTIWPYFLRTFRRPTQSSALFIFCGRRASLA